MSWVAAGVTVGSALFGASREKKAAKQREAAMRAAIDQQRVSYNEATEYLEPRAEQEQSAMGRVNALLGLEGEAPDYSTFTESPGYQFQLDQGTQAIERSAAARGGLQSGNTLAAATEYATGLADTTFNNYLAQVMGLQNQGVDFTQANMATQYGANVGNLLTGQGEARASGTTGAANSLIAGAGAFTDIWGQRQGWGRRPGER
jgi:hypothetical protein